MNVTWNGVFGRNGESDKNGGAQDGRSDINDGKVKFIG